MIGKVTRGSDVGGLLRYLYGPGKANEHTNPHLVASWRGDARLQLDRLEPKAGRGRQHFAHLADRLSLPLSLLPDVPPKHVWQCSMRLADGDRHLSDAEWASVAREVVQSAGFAPDADPGGCRWVAVRHAEDHIHVVLVLARQDGQPVDTFRDWPKVHAAARAVESRLGLTSVPSPDRTATVAPSRAEAEKASRLGKREPARVWLTREVRAAAAGSTSRRDFERLLARHHDVVVAWRCSQRNPGEVTGYRIGRVGDVDRTGQQVWFSGSKLSPDLSLPKLQARWAESGGGHSRQKPFADRTAVLDRTAQSLARVAAGADHPGVALSASEVATSFARLVEGNEGGPLTDAAEEQTRAARLPRGVRPAMSQRVHVLRHVASDLSQLGHLLPAEADHALQIVIHLMRLAANLEKARGTPGPPGGRSASRHYAAFVGPVAERQRAQLHAAVSESLALAVLSDPAWPALAAQLRRTEAAGADPVVVLQAVTSARELASADSVAAVLHHRLMTMSRSATPQAPPISSPAKSRLTPARTRYPPGPYPLWWTQGLAARFVGSYENGLDTP